MPHIKHKNQPNFHQYYQRQVGRRVIPYYSGRQFQRGYGLGHFLARLAKGLIPLLQKPFIKKVGKTVKKKLIATALDLSSGKNPKKTVKKRLSETGNALLNQTGSLILKTALKKENNPPKKQSKIKRKIKKKVSSKIIKGKNLRSQAKKDIFYK